MKIIQIHSLEALHNAVDKFIAAMDGHTIFAFQGTMGAGKTTFIKAVCERLGVKDVVGSPTFAIINEYHSDTIIGKTIYHFDFYRIDSLLEAYNLGVEDYLLDNALCFIEWPEKIKPLLPVDTVFVILKELADGSRLLQM